ncbi:MAG: family 16 glycosylhydrolase [Bacteroidia bacterium]|nr:family 16 glycosylhydrolase [Bacteroidia bacterium]
MKKTIILALCVVFSSSIYAQSKLDKSNYHIVLEEDFDNITNINQLTGVWQFRPFEDPNMGWGDEPSDTNYLERGEFYNQSQVSLANHPTEANNQVLRLTAERIDSSVSMMDCHGNVVQERRCSYISGMIETRKDIMGPGYDQGCSIWDANCQVNVPWNGFVYGMFEVRLKMDKGATFPAVWLAGPSQVNILEGKFSEMMYNVGFSSFWQNTKGRGRDMRKYGPDLSQNFHTYTAVWTPNAITYFFDGREVCTFTGSDVDALNLGNSCANVFRVTHQMVNYCTAQKAVMDIDYIRVYKPNGMDYSQSYKTQHENVNFNVFDNQNPTPVKVKNRARCITFDTTSGTQVFYAGEDGRFYESINYGTSTNPSWTTNQVPANYNPPLHEEITGNLVFDQNSGKYVYRGHDGRVQYYHYGSNGWFHDYIDNNWGQPYEVANDDAVLAIADNSSIFYKGMADQEIHYFASGSGAHHAKIGYVYAPAEKVKGDIVLEKIGNFHHVIYKGADNRLQIFWVDTTNNYQHAYIDDNWTTSAYLVNDRPGSIVMGDLGEVFYIGMDNKIHRFYFQNNTWHHDNSILAYSYGAPTLGYTNADYARKGITYDKKTRKVLYFGEDGRLQYFGVDPSTGNWYHAWMDDYWSTPMYASYDGPGVSTMATPDPSIAFDVNTGRVYYAGAFNYPLPQPQGYETYQEGHLRYFEYINCDNLRTNPGGIGNLDAPAKPDETLGLLESVVEDEAAFAYPNPSKDGMLNIRLESHQGNSTPKIEVFDIQGQRVWGGVPNGDGTINLSQLTGGVYQIRMLNKGAVFVQKIILND